ncbi:MAG: hypothetical protein M1837_002988 [Sclerophora amabilis]|nr:MAG: hypothetical protein M1837_002988 [Sclerophora amabilis]
MAEPSSPSQSPLPDPKPVQVSSEHLKAWLPLYLKKADATISHLNRLLSTPSGTDRVLCTLNYTLLALLTTVDNLRPLLHRFSTTPVTPIKRLSPITATKTHPLRALASLISDIRVFLRLWGLLSIYTWGRDVFVTSPPHDRALRLIAYTQVAVNAAYQTLENGAYLAQHKVLLGWSEKAQTRAWVWSSRFWAAHTALDLVRLLRVRQLRSVKGGRNGEKVDETEEDVLGWWSEVLVNAAYAPLTVHWSLEEGLIEEVWVGLFGSVAGLVGLRQSWRKTA